MITIIIPTRNRSYTLKKVIDSYYQQKHVTEIIFVDDCGDDDTDIVVKNISLKYNNINTKYIKHNKQKGASAGRITGYKNSINEYILFGEDDAYLEFNYTDILLNKIKNNKGIGIVSGRIIYKKVDENNKESLIRFGLGIQGIKHFNNIKFGWNSNAFIDSDVEVPMTHALFLTHKNLLIKYGYDPFYSKGNGYREESDYQMNLFINNYQNIMTADTCCYHMNKAEVNSGGQRLNKIMQLYWNIFYTNYFYNKYFKKASIKLDIKYNKNIALSLFSVQQFYELIIKSIIRKSYNLFKIFIK